MKIVKAKLRHTRRRARIEAVVIFIARALTIEKPETLEGAMIALDQNFVSGSGEQARKVAILVAQGKPAREAMNKHPASTTEQWTDQLAKLVDAFITMRGGKIRR